MNLRTSISCAVGFLAGIVNGACAQTSPDWTEPFPPFRIAGNLYYVGSKGLASYLITTSQGHILINSDLEANVPMIRTSVEQLGLELGDVKILLISHAHWDHDAGSARVKQLTGAKYMVMEGDVPVVESGGKAFEGRTDESGLHVVDRGLNGAVVGLKDGELALSNLYTYDSGNQVKSYIFTDRPIYRPNQTVHLKAVHREIVRKAGSDGLPEDSFSNVVNRKETKRTTFRRVVIGLDGSPLRRSPTRSCYSGLIAATARSFGSLPARRLPTSPSFTSTLGMDIWSKSFPAGSLTSPYPGLTYGSGSQSSGSAFSCTR